VVAQTQSLHEFELSSVRREHVKVSGDTYEDGRHTYEGAGHGATEAGSAWGADARTGGPKHAAHPPGAPRPHRETGGIE
jgi:hypothetical protein